MVAQRKLCHFFTFYQIFKGGAVYTNHLKDTIIYANFLINPIRSVILSTGGISRSFTAIITAICGNLEKTINQ